MKRVQEWRKQKSGYWRAKNGANEAKSGRTLPDSCSSQVVDNEGESPPLSESALQDTPFSQVFVYVGLMSMLTGCTLQDDIVNCLRRLHIKGHEILGTMSGVDLTKKIIIDYDQKDSQRRPDSSGSISVQLDGPPHNPQPTPT